MMAPAERLSVKREVLLLDLKALGRAAGARRAISRSLSSESSMTWFALGAIPLVEQGTAVSCFCSDVLRLVLSVANAPSVVLWSL